MDATIGISHEPHLDYPFSLPSFCPGLDDGQFCQRELKEESRSWRSEKYPPISSVLIFDHDHGVGTTGTYNDNDIDRLLAVLVLLFRFQIQPANMS